MKHSHKNDTHHTTVEQDAPGTGSTAPSTKTQDSQSAREAKLKRRERIRRLIIVLLLLLFIGCGVYSVSTCESEQVKVPDQAVAVMPDLDVNAKEITSKESLQTAMQEEADAHYFTLQVYPEANFSASTGEGSFSLMNPDTNVYPLSFEITRDDTGEKLYESGTLLPGQQINTLALDTWPQAGTYEATVHVSIFDAETQTKEGETEAKITLYVV